MKNVMLVLLFCLATAVTPEVPRRIEPVSIRDVTLRKPYRYEVSQTTSDWTIVEFQNVTPADMPRREGASWGVFVGEHRCIVVWREDRGLCVVPGIGKPDSEFIWHSFHMPMSGGVGAELKKLVVAKRAMPLAEVKRLEAIQADSMESLLEMLPLLK